MTLLRESWKKFDPHELRLLLNASVGGPGQYANRSGNPNKLYLPLAGSSCRIGLTFRGSAIIAIEPGEAFDAGEWKRLSEKIEESVLAGPMKTGREFSFSSFRVQGSWRGDTSGLQILPPPESAPHAPVEHVEHPFILEFPLRASDVWPVTNYRRMRKHRGLTLLLNVLLAGRVSLDPRRSESFWALVPRDDDPWNVEWVQRCFPAKLGNAILDGPSAPAARQLEAVEPEEYYTKVGLDGKGLRVPTDLDDSISRYLQLPAANRAKFDRATFWMDLASRQWTISVSASFASLVSAVEALTDRGTVHPAYCETCGDACQHEVPGATERFRSFFDKYAPDSSLSSRRSKMYSLRSSILHGSELMQLDQDIAFGWDPPHWNQRELHEELWGLTRIAMRNWLKNPSPGRGPRALKAG